MALKFKNLLPSITLLSCAIVLLGFSISAECGILNISVKDVSGSPADGIVFQIFPGKVNVDDNVMYLKLGNPASDKKDNDGDGETDESGEDFPGYATDADGTFPRVCHRR